MRRQLFSYPSATPVVEPRSVWRRGGAQPEGAGLDDEVQFVKDLLEIPVHRRSKVIRLREAIREGTYLTEDKLEQALERLLAVLEAETELDG